MQRLILITGISTGIGKAFIELASQAYPNDKIIALTRNKVQYDLPSNVTVYYVNITDFDKTNKLYKKIIKTHGVVDILINNAGNGAIGTIEDTTISEAKVQLDLNVWAAVNLIQQVLPSMRQRKSGHIINISSVAATLDYPTMAYYGASKALIEKISRILTMEVKDWNINVSSIAPGTIKTKFGKNMSRVSNMKDSPYESLYIGWANKFAHMFKQTNSSEDVAKTIIRVIENPRSERFVIKRDKAYVRVKEIVSHGFFNKYIIDRYMRTVKKF